MEDLYSIHPGISRAGEIAAVGSASSCDDGSLLRFDRSSAAAERRSGASDASEICDPAAGVRSDVTDLIKARIASHPRYPSLLSAYIDCRKVGAPPDTATLLQEVGRRKHAAAAGCGEMGADPELDEFMESYCRVLLHFKEELSRPFDEAASFLASVESQLRELCTATSATATATADEAAGSSDEEPSCGNVDASEGQEGGSHSSDHELKDMLLKKYSGYLSSLRKEFLKKRKKGKLPKDARSVLLDWWNTHYRWPYPTDGEKAKLAEMTGLDKKQINNWFINQRKRHWKPSEDVQFALMQGVSGGSSGATMLYFDTGTVGP